MTVRLALAIETSNPGATPASPGGVALGELGVGGARLIGVEPLRAGDRHDADLVPAIDRLFIRAGARRADLARVIVSAGPGGFTGLRMAVACAKMIAFATGARCVGVPSAAVVARGFVGRADRTAVALASKRVSAFVTVFERAGRALTPGEIADSAGMIALRPGLVVADRFLPPPISDALRNAGVPVEPPVFDPGACLALGAEADPVDPSDLAPFYPRPPEAVVKWRELHPSQTDPSPPRA